VTTTSHLNAGNNQNTHLTPESRLEAPNPHSSHKRFPGGATRTNVTDSGENEHVKLSAEIPKSKEKASSDVPDSSPKAQRLSKSEITLLPPGWF